MERPKTDEEAKRIAAGPLGEELSKFQENRDRFNFWKINLSRFFRFFVPVFTIGTNRMTTPLYPTFQKRINDSFDQLIKDQVTPWAFLNSGKPMRVTTHDQRQISYVGGGFEGSPADVFWSRYIEPFMEEISIKEIDAAVKMAEEKHVDATQLLPEVEGLLLAGVRKIFSEMAKTDQRLRGSGFPEKIPLRPIENEFQRMKSFIEVRIQSELEMWKPKLKLEAWYERNKFIVWLVGIVVGLVGLYAKFK